MERRREWEEGLYLLGLVDEVCENGRKGCVC